MSRLFEDAGQSDQKRKWQCFVCGKHYSSYEEYKSHIVSEHDEGREYLKCPDCEAPVRDMRAHYKAKHPSRVMPNTQLKVGVWHDFAPSGKKKKTRKPTFMEGYYTSAKMGDDLHYRSGMEQEVYVCLEHDADVIQYFPEPFKVPYFHNGKWHDYIPDLKVVYTDGSVQVMEVKPANQTDYEQNKAKWAAMNDYALNLGWDFTVITEVGLGKLKNKVKQQK